MIVMLLIFSSPSSKEYYFKLRFHSHGSGEIRTLNFVIILLYCNLASSFCPPPRCFVFDLLIIES